MSVAVQTSCASGVGQFKTLYRLLAELSHASALEDVYNAALTSLLDATDADRAAILLYDDDGVMRFKASRNLSAEYQAAVTGHSPWPPGTQDAQPLAVPDVFLDGNLVAFRADFERERIRSLTFIPLALGAGVFGKFMLYYSQPHDPSTEELEVATVIAAHVALATEHKRAEIARNTSQQRLRAILNNSPTVVFLKDQQGRYLHVNRRWEELFQFGEAEVLGRADRDIFPAATADHFRENDKSVIAAGRSLAFEEQVPQGNGIHTYLSVKFPLEDAEGQITGICGIATDITERKRLEVASQRLAAIVESSEDAIVSKDLNGVITSWNNGAERTFGYTAEEAIGKPIAMLAAPERLDEMPGILETIRQGKRVGHYETRRRRKDGRIIDVALTVSPIYDISGQIIGASKIARDITEIKLAERERAELLAREREAHRIAELLNQVAPRFAAQLDLQRLVQEVIDIATALVAGEFGAFLHNAINEKGEGYVLSSLSGVSRDTFEGFPLPRNTFLLDPTCCGESIVRCDDVTQDARFRQSPLFEGRPEGDVPVRSYLAAAVVSRSGEVLGGLFFGHSQPGKFTPAHEGILTGIAAQAGIAIDNARLFEQAQWTQAELKRSNEDLRRANRDLEVFAYSASHDLQEPLRTIALSAQLIQRSAGERLLGDSANLLANILAAARRMSTLIEDLLAYTRATKYEEGPVPDVEPSEILDEVLLAMRAPIEDAGAVVTATELPPVAIHPSRLAQLLQNLLSNAIKYRGNEAPRIQVGAHERDGWCVFSVTDNGIGLDPKYGEQIFGLFKRLHKRDEYPGSGIGLAICQRVVEQYGGRIWLECSAPGAGSTFCFSLPTGTSGKELSSGSSSKAAYDGR